MTPNSNVAPDGPQDQKKDTSRVAAQDSARKPRRRQRRTKSVPIPDPADQIPGSASKQAQKQNGSCDTKTPSKKQRKWRPRSPKKEGYFPVEEDLSLPPPPLLQPCDDNGNSVTTEDVRSTNSRTSNGSNELVEQSVKSSTKKYRKVKKTDTAVSVGKSADVDKTPKKMAPEAEIQQLKDQQQVDLAALELSNELRAASAERGGELIDQQDHQAPERPWSAADVEDVRNVVNTMEDRNELRNRELEAKVKDHLLNVAESEDLNDVIAPVRVPEHAVDVPQSLVGEAWTVVITSFFLAHYIASSLIPRFFQCTVYFTLCIMCGLVGTWLTRRMLKMRGGIEMSVGRYFYGLVLKRVIAKFGCYLVGELESPFTATPPDHYHLPRTIEQICDEENLDCRIFKSVFNLIQPIAARSGPDKLAVAIHNTFIRHYEKQIGGKAKLEAMDPSRKKLYCDLILDLALRDHTWINATADAMAQRKSNLTAYGARSLANAR